MMKAAEFTTRLANFTEESLLWCVTESETATARISQAVDMILKDAARVSRLSSAGEAAVRALQTEMSTQKKMSIATSPALKRLKKLVAENAEMRQTIDPLIQTLQFQDAFRQQLENVVKVMRLWLAERAKVEKTHKFGEKERAAFGEGLAKLMTMASERDVLRQVFPEAKIPEEQAASNLEFF